jgi:hypothetical protein
MPTTPRPAQDKDKGKEQRERDSLVALIGEWVLRTLGKPHGLRGVQVRHLWEDHYRVNVLVGQDAASARVAHSYFLVADQEGDISASTPEITRQY